MNKSLLLASLVAAIALSACGKKEEAPAPVSYTHLTLPTSDLV